MQQLAETSEKTVWFTTRERERRDMRAIGRKSQLNLRLTAAAACSSNAAAAFPFLMAIGVGGGWRGRERGYLAESVNRRFASSADRPDACHTHCLRRRQRQLFDSFLFLSPPTTTPARTENCCLLSTFYLVLRERRSWSAALAVSDWINWELQKAMLHSGKRKWSHSPLYSLAS